MEISVLADFPHEAAKIAKWYFDEWAWMAPAFTEAMVLERVVERAINRKKIPLSLVAHIDGKLVGVIELKIRENLHYPDYEYWIGGIFTHSSHRRKCIASKLIDSAKQKAIGFGVQKLYL